MLFFVGGAIALMINGVNVTIPAHYHGSIIGITVALMGLSYYVLEQKYHCLINHRVAKWQIYLYSFGQLMHITGLAWSGGYGVLRKSPGGMLSVKAKISMGLMGAGGLIAIIGGLLFVVICINGVRSPDVRQKG
jgi:heme/copper-type cytochrome/quinol oxidase subunit 1